MSELAKVDRNDLLEHFPRSANFIELICQGKLNILTNTSHSLAGGVSYYLKRVLKYLAFEGIDEDPVKPRDKQLSIAVSRNFTGKAALNTVNDVKVWLRNLVNDLCARMVADQSKVSFT